MTDEALKLAEEVLSEAGPKSLALVELARAYKELHTRAERAEASVADAHDILMAIAGQLELPRSAESGPPDDQAVYIAAIDELQAAYQNELADSKEHADARWKAEARVDKWAARVAVLRETLEGALEIQPYAAEAALGGDTADSAWREVEAIHKDIRQTLSDPDTRADALLKCVKALELITELDPGWRQAREALAAWKRASDG